VGAGGCHVRVRKLKGGVSEFRVGSTGGKGKTRSSLKKRPQRWTGGNLRLRETWADIWIYHQAKGKINKLDGFSYGKDKHSGGWITICQEKEEIGSLEGPSNLTY